MNALDIVKAAYPLADEEFADFIMWERTPFPCGKVSAKAIYEAASRYIRAGNNQNQLCDFCDNLALEKSLCKSCRDSLSNSHDAEQRL